MCLLIWERFIEDLCACVVSFFVRAGWAVGGMGVGKKRMDGVGDFRHLAQVRREGGESTVDIVYVI